MIKLRSLKEAELDKFKQIVNSKFDDNKNWSIMMKQKDNSLRNQIM